MANASDPRKPVRIWLDRLMAFVLMILTGILLVFTVVYVNYLVDAIEEDSTSVGNFIWMGWPAAFAFVMTAMCGLTALYLLRFIWSRLKFHWHKLFRGGHD